MDELENGGQSALNSEGTPPLDPAAESQLSDTSATTEQQYSTTGSPSDAANGSGESLNTGEQGNANQQERRVSESVPYDRFKTVNDELAQVKAENANLKRWSELEPVLTEDPALGPYLKAGLSPVQALERYRFDQQQRSDVARQTEEYKTGINNLVEQGLVDPSVAEYFNPLLERLANVEPLAKSFEQQRVEGLLNADIESVMKDFDKADRESVRLALLQTQGNVPYAREIAQRQHATIMNLETRNADDEQRRIADYNARVAKRDGVVSVEGGKGGESAATPAKSAIPDPVKNPAEFEIYLNKIKAMPRRAYG